jgi:ATP-dependent phosphoenolpyruvate carboxykinase
MDAEPEATFSACFGAPFMTLHPTVYAKLLRENIETHKVACWLVNTGWSGGPFGVGQRMKIAHTRALVRAALTGKLAQVPMEPDGVRCERPAVGVAVREELRAVRRRGRRGRPGRGPRDRMIGR